MQTDMRLFRRKDSPNWYVEIERGKAVSLKTNDETLAKEIFKEMKRHELQTRLYFLDTSNRITLLQWKEKYLSGRSHLSEHTIMGDDQALKLFGDVIGHHKAVKTIDRQCIQDFITVMLGRGIKVDSLNTHLGRIKASLREAKRNGYLKDVPEIKLLKAPKRLPRTIPGNRLRTVMGYMKRIDYEVWRLCEFARWTAARRQEVIDVRWEHLDGNYIRIIGKGDKERSIPLVKQAKIAMGEPADIGPVFQRMNPATLNRKFRGHCQACGFKATFHMLRHSSATRMLENGIPLEVIQKVLGHKNIRTTQRYAQVSNELARRYMEKKFKF